MRTHGDDTTDAALVAALRRGDERAFEQLYVRYQRRIAAFVFGMVRDHGRAEDITQEVFLSALRRLRETDRPVAFRPWLYEIAKNACIDHFRRTRRGEEISYDAGEGEAGSAAGRVLTGGSTPDVQVEGKLALDQLCGAFGGLSETHHQILVMRELEGLSYREIGERLGMSRPAVESTLFRARRRLSEEYEELVSGERCRRVQAIVAGAATAAPGARDQRRLAAHVSHCQPCRRQAHTAGIDVRTLTARGTSRARIAAFLPLPGFLRRRLEGGEVPGAGHSGTLAQWSAQLGGSIDPGLASWMKAAAAATTVAVVGVGAGEGTSRLVDRPAAVRPPAAHVHPAAGRTARPPVAPTSAGPRPVAARRARPVTGAGLLRPVSRPAVTSPVRVAASTSTSTSTPAAAPARTPAATLPATVRLPSAGAAAPSAADGLLKTLPVLGPRTPGVTRPAPPVDPVPLEIPAVGAAVDEAIGAGTQAVGALTGIVTGR